MHNTIVSKNYKILYIIGNGFDLHHGLKSSYSHFEDYVKKNDKKSYQYIEEYLTFGQSWNELESALANLEIENIQDECSQYLASYADEKWSDSMHHEYEFFMEEILGVLSSKLLELFTSWINKVKIPNKAYQKKTKWIKYKDSVFLTFNYTNVLNKLYNIKEKDTLFIHGKLDNPILGHAYNFKSLKGDASTDTRVLGGYELLNSYFATTFKNTKLIISNNIAFFQNLKNINEVYVLGHSISHVDIEYFKKINKNISSKTIWNISYRDTNRQNYLRKVLVDIGISSKSINFIKLMKKNK